MLEHVMSSTKLITKLIRPSEAVRMEQLESNIWMQTTDHCLYSCKPLHGNISIDSVVGQRQNAVRVTTDVIGMGWLYRTR